CRGEFAGGSAMFVVRVGRHHVDSVPHLILPIRPRPTTSPENLADISRVEDHELPHRLLPPPPGGPPPALWEPPGWPGRVRPAPHYANNSDRTLPPSTISIGRLPGAISSSSAMMPRRW